MATLLSLLHPVSGRIGDKIYCVRNGISYVRSLPKKTTIAPTEKQLIQRVKFSLVMSFLAPIISILNESYQKINPRKTGTKMAANQIFENALTGEYPHFEIDYSKVNLVRGSLNAPMSKMTYVAGSNELDFTWSVGNTFNKQNDVLWPLIYCCALNEFWYDLNLGIRYGDEFGTIKIPVKFTGYEIHVWLAYHSNNCRAFSDSTYMGRVLTHKSRSHEQI